MSTCTQCHFVCKNLCFVPDLGLNQILGFDYPKLNLHISESDESTCRLAGMAGLAKCEDIISTNKVFYIFVCGNAGHLAVSESPANPNIKRNRYRTLRRIFGGSDSIFTKYDIVLLRFVLKFLQ
jgi:hypothetical protein